PSFGDRRRAPCGLALQVCARDPVVVARPLAGTGFAGRLRIGPLVAAHGGVRRRLVFYRRLCGPSDLKPQPRTIALAHGPSVCDRPSNDGGHYFFCRWSDRCRRLKQSALVLPMTDSTG